MNSDDAATADRERKVARAWTLHAQRWSLRQIAAEIGGVSHVTVMAWITEAREAAEWIEVTQARGRRARMGEFLNELARIGVERLTAVDEDGAPVERYKDVVPGLMSVVSELNRVEGNYAPTRTVSEIDRRPPTPGLVKALEEETRRIEAADDEELRRELEQ